MKQLVFDLPRRASFGRDDFFVSDSNTGALGWIERWPNWPVPALVLHGPRGAGKTHLAYLWRDRAAAMLLSGASLDEADLTKIIERRSLHIGVDDADCAPEAILLHLYNFCLEEGGSLLLTARQQPGLWPMTLADLGSRLRAAPAVGIDAAGRRAPKRGLSQAFRRSASAGRAGCHRLSRQSHGAVARRRWRTRRGLGPGGAKPQRVDHDRIGEPYSRGIDISRLAARQRCWGHVIDEAIARVAKPGPSGVDFEAGAGPSRKLAGPERSQMRRIGLCERCRQLMQSRVVANQQHLADALIQLSQAIDQPIAFSKIKPPLDETWRRRRKFGECQFQGLASANRGRTQHQIDRPDGAEQMPTDELRRFAPALVQRPLVILDILFPARFRMAQQVQQVHPRFSSRSGRPHPCFRKDMTRPHRDYKISDG